MQLVADKVEVIFAQCSAMRIFIQLTALGGMNVYMNHVPIIIHILM
jgi:hypothetical protein